MLVQSEADRLTQMPKRFLSINEVELPSAGDSATFKLQSTDRRHKFLMDASRTGRIAIARCSYQERYQVIEILARLDIGGPPHTNPHMDELPLAVLRPHNGARVPCPHFHLYVEGFNDRWAIPAAEEGFDRTDDLAVAFAAFMRHCGVDPIPNIQMRLI